MDRKHASTWKRCAGAASGSSRAVAKTSNFAPEKFRQSGINSTHGVASSRMVGERVASWPPAPREAWYGTIARSRGDKGFGGRPGVGSRGRREQPSARRCATYPRGFGCSCHSAGSRAVIHRPHSHAASDVRPCGSESHRPNGFNCALGTATCSSGRNSTRVWLGRVCHLLSRRSSVVRAYLELRDTHLCRQGRPCQ